MHHFILGRVHLIRKEYDQSIGNLETAVNLNPCMATAHCGLGDSLAFSGRFDEAVPHFKDAVRLGPRDTRRWAILVYGSLTLMLLEQYDEAIAWAREAVRLPNSIFWTVVGRQSVRRKSLSKVLGSIHVNGTIQSQSVIAMIS